MAETRPPSAQPAPDRRAAAAPTARRVVLVRSWWWIVFVGAVTLALGFLLVQLLGVLARPLALLFLAAAVAAALAPIVAWLERRAPRPAAVLAPYLTALLITGGLGWLSAAPLAAQAQAAVLALPELIASVTAWASQEEAPLVSRFFDAATSQIIGGVTNVVTLPLLIFSSVFEIVTVVFMSIYWLLVAPQLQRFALSLLPERQHAPAKTLVHDMGRTMGGYLRGVAMNSVIVGVMTYIGLLLIGVQFPLVLAIIAGLLEAAPYIGPIVAAVPIVGVAALDSPAQALITLVFWVAVQQFEGNLLTPVVMRSQAHIPPLLVVFALLAGYSIAGILGALVAIPLSGALRVFVNQVGAPAIRRWSGAAALEPVTAIEPQQEAA